MRIELKYKSTCPTSKKLRDHIEGIIAEEALPLAVEVVEAEEKESPTVRIHASHAASGEPDKHEINCENHGSEEQKFLDNLRRVVLEKWHDHAIHPLSHLQ
jgi:hypothetical protein